MSLVIIGDPGTSWSRDLGGGGAGLAGAAGGVPGACGTVPVNADSGGVVEKLSSGGLEDVAGEFLDDLPGMALDCGLQGLLYVDGDCAAFEVAVGDQQESVAG